MTKKLRLRNVVTPNLLYVKCVGILRSQIEHSQVPNDPSFPYVGKYIANLTLAQIKTLDCGSQRQANYRKEALVLFASLK